MDIDEEQIQIGQNLVNKFMAKDRGNLKYLNLGVVIIGVITYFWIMDDLDDDSLSYIILPIILIGFGGLIVYFTWYWKYGPGNEWLNILEATRDSNNLKLPSQFEIGPNNTQRYAKQMESPIQFQMPTSSPSPLLAKICPYCQTQNPHTSSHCELCLEKIPELKLPSNNYNSLTNEIKVRDNNNLKPQINIF